MVLKRKDDFEILTRIEGKQDDMGIALALLDQKVVSIDKSINKDNGVKCIQSRLKMCEDVISRISGDGEIKSAQWKFGTKILLALGSIPGGLLVLLEIAKIIGVIK